LAAELTTDPEALVTEEATLVRGLLPVEADVGPVGTEPVSAEAADVTAESAPGCSSPVAAWACLEKSSRRNRIPAAAIANCATRTAARCASGCDIDSSHPQRNRSAHAGKKDPDQPSTTVEDEAFCTATTVHHRR
jgi:hypothetical protein